MLVSWHYGSCKLQFVGKNITIVDALSTSSHRLIPACELSTIDDSTNQFNIVLFRFLLGENSNLSWQSQCGIANIDIQYDIHKNNRMKKLKVFCSFHSKRALISSNNTKARLFDSEKSANGVRYVTEFGNYTKTQRSQYSLCVATLFDLIDKDCNSLRNTVRKPTASITHAAD